MRQTKKTKTLKSCRLKISEGLCGGPQPLPAQACVLRDGALRLRGGVEHAAVPDGGQHVAQLELEALRAEPAAVRAGRVLAAAADRRRQGRALLGVAAARVGGRDRDAGRARICVYY